MLRELFGKPDPVNGSLFEAPETLMLPMDYETEENVWFADGFRTFTSLPWKVQLLIMSVYAFTLLMNLGVEYVTSHFLVHHDPINYLMLRNSSGDVPSAMATTGKKGLLSHTTKSHAAQALASGADEVVPLNATIWDYPYAYLMRHQYILHAFTSLIPHCLSWMLLCPLVAVYFLYRQAPQYFNADSTDSSNSTASGSSGGKSSSSGDDEEDDGLFPKTPVPTSPTSSSRPFFEGAASNSGLLGCLFGGSAKAFGDAYMYAFQLLWARSINVFIWYTAPTLGLRLLFIAAVGAFAQRSFFIFSILFLLFAAAALYVMVLLTFSMPIFVDHPGFSAPVVLRVSADLVRRNMMGIVRFNAYTVLLLLFGLLLFVVGYFATAPICLFALAAAYRGLIGVYTWTGQGFAANQTSDQEDYTGVDYSKTVSHSSMPSFLEDEETIV